MERPPRGAGELDTRGTLQEPNTTQDTSGQEVPAWTNVKTVWMKVEAISGTESPRGSQIEPTATFSVWMRYRSDVKTQWRIRLSGNRTLELLSAVDPDNRKTWLSCSAKEVAS